MNYLIRDRIIYKQSKINKCKSVKDRSDELVDLLRSTFFQVDKKYNLNPREMKIDTFQNFCEVIGEFLNFFTESETNELSYQV